MIRALAIAGLSLAAASTARAEEAAARAAAVIEEVCLRPTSSAGLMAAAENAAGGNRWTLNLKLSGSQRGVLQSGPGKPIALLFRRKVWDLVGRDGGNGTLSVQIVGGGPPGQRFDSCQVAVPGDVAAEIESELSRRVSLGTKLPMSSNASGWVLAGDVARPDRGYRVLGVSTQDLPASKTCPDSGPCETKSARRITAVGVLAYKTAPGSTAASPTGSVP